MIGWTRCARCPAGWPGLRARWFALFAALWACNRLDSQPAGSPGTSGVSRQTAAACALIARLVEPTPGADTTRAEGPFEDPFGQEQFTGCQVLLTGSFAALGEHPRPDVVLEDTFLTQGWTQETSWAADGPDGTDFAFRHDGTVCIVVGRWDGGVFEEDDPPPSDRYDVHVGCMDRTEPLGTAPAGDSGGARRP